MADYLGATELYPDLFFELFFHLPPPYFVSPTCLKPIPSRDWEEIFSQTGRGGLGRRRVMGLGG